MRESERFFNLLMGDAPVEFWGIIKSPNSPEVGKTRKFLGHTQAQQGLRDLRRVFDKIRGFDLYWRPYRGLRTLKVLFFDDIDERLMSLEYLSILQTSASSFQGFIALDEEIETQFVGDIQRAVARYGHSDKGAASAFQLRRFPGSPNHKYGKAFISKLIKLGYKVPISKVLKDLGELGITVHSTPQIGETNGDVHPRAIRPGHNNYRKYVPRETFETGDPSQTDWRWVLSLLRRGFSKEEVANFLLRESPMIGERKEGHLQDYIWRTVNKAYNRL